MNAVAVKTGDKVLYIETECIDEIIMDPEIHEVPQADDNISGIAFYEGKLIIYYRFGNNRSVRCGILMKGKDNYRTGVLADDVTGGTVVDREELTLIISGVWEKKSD